MPDRDEVRDGLARVQRQIDSRQRDLVALYERRLQLLEAGRRCDPPMKHVELAHAAGIAEDAVTKALAKARRMATAGNGAT